MPSLAVFPHTAEPKACNPLPQTTQQLALRQLLQHFRRTVRIQHLVFGQPLFDIVQIRHLVGNEGATRRWSKCRLGSVAAP